MHTYRVMITGVSGDIGYSCVRALFEERCYTLYGTDMSPLCPVCNLLESFHVVPPVTSYDYLKKILSLVKTYNIEILLPTSEAEIFFFNKNRELFQSIGCILAINNKNIIDCFSSKYRTASFVKKIGLKAPDTYMLSDYKMQLSYPIILKPDCSCGSKSIFLINDEKSFTSINRQDIPYVVQKYIPGDNEEYTSTVFSDGNRTETITFHRTLRNGLSFFVELVNSSYMKELGKRLASSIDLHGSINVQTRKVDNEHIIFEINPRLSSTVFFRKMVGFKDAHWWLQTLLGLHISSFSLTKQHFQGLRYFSEVQLK